MFAGIVNVALRQSARPNPKPRRYSTTEEQNRVRTEKSRQVIAVNRAKRKLQQSERSAEPAAANLLIEDGLEDKGYATRLQQHFLSPLFSHAQFQPEYKGKHWRFEVDRARCLVSLIQALATMLNGLCGAKTPIHTMDIVTADDTSVRLRSPGASATSVYTVMNVVQALYVRDSVDQVAENSIASCNIPNPLMILENADANAIHKAFAASSLLTSKGVGKLFQRFGVHASSFPGELQTLVFVGDALKANSKAYEIELSRLEKKRQSSPNDSIRLMIKLRCSLHQINLIRKPLVLLPARFWTTLVRLSHLYESMTFRKHMATTLTALIRSSFVNIRDPESEQTTDFQEWRKIAVAVKDSISISSPQKMQQLSNMIDFLNGDWSQPTICHYCTFSEGKACCESYKQSLCKCLKVCIPYFASGFGVPLLYRFKHYGPAASFAYMGCRVHQLLGRAMSLLDTTPSASQGWIDALLGSQSEAFLDDLLDQDASFQDTNAKRKELVKAELSRSDFHDAALVINLLIQPMERVTNQLLKRSSIISKLTHFGTFAPDWQELLHYNKQHFLDFVLGRFGWRLVKEYSTLFGDVATQVYIAKGMPVPPSALQGMLTMVLICMSDTWRRFVWDFASFPQKMFLLIDGTLTGDMPSVEDFCQLWDTFGQSFCTCPDCLDPGFSRELFRRFSPKLSVASTQMQKSVQEKLVAVLTDVAVFSPLSSDSVEVKNGAIQLMASRRGNQAVKAPKAARESSMLMSAIRQHDLVKLFVDQHTLPSKRTRASIVKMLGTKGKQRSQTSDAWLKHIKPHHTSNQCWVATLFPKVLY